MAGISVLAIDDCDGRDLPLLRAQASEGQAFIRRVGRSRIILSIGVPLFWVSGILIVRPLLICDSSQVGRGNAGGQMLKGAARLELLADYYNGRIAVWEPVLEKVSTIVSPPKSHSYNSQARFDRPWALPFF
jgi:hypothetical protein